MLKKLLLVSALLFSVVCRPGTVLSQDGRELTVSAAISLKNVFEEIGLLFQQTHAGTKVSFNFGASGALAGQIEAGAPVDVFASASLKDMDVLQQKGLIMAPTRANFARNSIVFIAPAKSALHLKTADDLKKPGVKKIAIGNPDTVPAGRYAIDALAYYKLSDVLKDKYVLGENVRQVLDYVARGEVDAGIVYKTDALVQARDVAVFLQPPETSHRPVLYPIAAIAGSKNIGLAKRFIDFVAVSGEAHKILQKHGFVPTEHNK